MWSYKTGGLGTQGSYNPGTSMDMTGGNEHGGHTIQGSLWSYETGGLRTQGSYNPRTL